MTANPCSLRLHWSNLQTVTRSKQNLVVPQEFNTSDSFQFFKAGIAEFYFFYLSDTNGRIVDPSWFGFSRKKDKDIVTTLYEILERALQKKTLHANGIVTITEFQVIKDLLNLKKLKSKLDPSMGLQLFVRLTGAIATSCIDSLRQDQTIGLDTGRRFGSGLWYGPDEAHKKFVKVLLSTALYTVIKKVIRETSNTSQCYNLTTNWESLTGFSCM